VHTVETAEARLEPEAFFARARVLLESGRLVTFYGGPGGAADTRSLTAVFAVAGRIEVLRSTVARGRGFHALTPEHACVHVFEREVHERWDVEPRGHPWLKPVRFSGSRLGETASYPFYRVEGKEVHEVGVGPIHAGVIEPGHFRFMCLGERVHHLEIQLGYQHRGVEDLLLRGAPWSLGPLVETIAGDTSVGHAWAYSAALEALAGVSPSRALGLARGVGLELERVAMHLATLSGLFADIAHLQGASTYGRLRTTIINATMRSCGSRFGRGWVRPGSHRVDLGPHARAALRRDLGAVRRDVAIVDELVRDARGVAHRLQGVGVVTTDVAARMGFVGTVARSCGIPLDARAAVDAQEPYRELRPSVAVEPAGDCRARAIVRMREIQASLDWVEAALECGVEATEPATRTPSPLAPGRISVAMVEGVRGEVVHVLETDDAGALRAYRAQDPSLRNWFALALAVRDEEIYDFPICNKSFDLSYCGHDL